MVDLTFFEGKRVFITGHTGFKGSWLCRILIDAGAQVTGYSLPPPTQPNLFSLAGIEDQITSIIGDIRDFEKLWRVFSAARPEIVLHLAAQPLVRESYRGPRATYETNVMGTVNLLECVRQAANEGHAPRSVVNITTDKVYQNKEWCWGYREDEPLDGFDPYSNSKSCSELVTHSYIKHCCTAHQKYQVDKETLFPAEYHYRSRFTKDVLDGMKDFVRSCKEKTGSLKGKTVVDVGCNDGSLLGYFREEGCATIGIEPTNACEYSFLSLLLGEREGVELNHLWFVSTLVAIYVVFPILHREFQAFLAEGAKDTYFCTFVMLLLLLYFVPIAGNTFFITPLFPQGIALNLSDISSQFLFCGYIGPMLFYFMLGGILHAYRKKLLKIPDYILVIGLMIGLVSLYGRWFLESAVLGSTWDNIYGAYCSFPCLLISVSLFLLFARISFDKVSMPLQKQLKIIGSNTLGVYYMHWIFGCTLLPSIHSVIGHDGLILNFIKALCIVLVFSYVSYFAKKVPFIKNMF